MPIFWSMHVHELTSQFLAQSCMCILVPLLLCLTPVHPHYTQQLACMCGRNNLNIFIRMLQ